MEKRVVLRVLVLSLCSQGLLACHSGQFDQQLVGDYKAGSSSSETFVSNISEVGAVTDNKVEIHSHDYNQSAATPLQGTLSLTSPTQMDAELTGLVNFSGSLQKNGNCFEQNQSGSSMKVCSDSAGLTIDYVNAPQAPFNITLTRATSDEIAKLEVPQSYTSSQLRDLAANRSFQDRTEIEQLLQAKLSSRVAYLNLLPHLNVNSALAVSQYSGLLSVAGSIGDLVPFLLPDRWFQAKESQDLYHSEILAQLIMKLDTMQGVEGLAINLGRDNAIDTLLQSDLQTMQTVATQVLGLEKAGKLPVGSADAINSTINIIAQTDSDLQSNIALELTALSQAVGFVNPNAITSVSVDPFGDINTPTTYDLPTLESSAVAVSPELKQLDSLFAAAQDQKKARMFQWLDPAGDDQGSVGAGLPSYLEIGQSGVREVTVQEDLTNSTILKNVTDNFNNYTGWIESYQLAQQGISIQQRRLADDLSVLNAGGAGLEIAELQDALQQQSVNQINLLTAQYAWYGNVSLFNRLLGLGAYQHQ